MAMEKVRQVNAAYTGALLSKRNVVACGVGYKITGGVRTDELAVIISVTHKVPRESLAPENLVPQALEGIQTDVQETGVIRALQDHTGKLRPAPGVSRAATSTSQRARSAAASVPVATTMP